MDYVPALIGALGGLGAGAAYTFVRKMGLQGEEGARIVFYFSLFSCVVTLTWSEELGKFLFVWITWLGISLGERKGEHIKITMLTDRLPFRVAQVVNILSEIIVIIICAVTFYYGITLVFSQMGTHYAGIKISVSWGYLAVVVGCGLMILRSVWGFGRSLKYLFKGAPAEQDGEEKGGAEQ